MKQSQQQTLAEPVIIEVEPEPPQQLEEINYQDTCYGKPCFKLDSEESDKGVCTETGVILLVELAKRQKLCDYEADGITKKRN
jgi:hypothetical protein